MPIRLDHSHRTFVVATGVFVVRERHALAVRRNLGMADPVNAVQQNLADGIFQPPVAVLRNEAHHRHAFAVGRPVGVLDIVQHFARRSSAQGNLGQRPRAGIAAEINGVQPDRQFSALRDGKQGRILQSQFARAIVIGASQIQLVRRRLPRTRRKQCCRRE